MSEPIRLITLSQVRMWIKMRASYHEKNGTSYHASYHIKFDLPGRLNATMVIHADGRPIAVVTCFKWKETFMLRKATKFGSNHQFEEIPWTKFSEVLGKMEHHFSLEQVITMVRE